MTTTMKELLKHSVEAGINYEAYKLLFEQLAKEGRTTGEPTEDKINFTKLNFSRSKRLDKTGVISDEQAKVFSEISEKQIWLVITEPWCGDAAQTLPYLRKMADCSENIELKLVLRDDHPELMDAFLTNGSRSIPKVIFLNEASEVLATWGPRSIPATKMVEEYKTKHGGLDAEFKKQLQIWYNTDKGQSVISDVSNIAATISSAKTTA